jgi:hypothetical protein
MFRYYRIDKNIATGWGMQIHYEKTKVFDFREGEGGSMGREGA